MNFKILNNPFLIVISSFYLIIWIILAINPTYRPQWFMENYLVFLFWGFLVVSYFKFKLSNISYLLIIIFLVFHSFGAHYGYCEVPFGYWLSNTFMFERINVYDRLVHFLFGFLLTYPIFEILRKYTNFSNFWLILLPTEFILSYSALYELIEAMVAWNLPAKDYDPFVGLQGDIWDGYRDMGLAFLGSLIVLLINLTINLFFKKIKIIIK